MDKRKFLVIVDPSHERQIALERMVEIIRQRQERELNVHLFIGFESDDRTADLPDEVVRGREWRRELIRPLIELNAEFTAEFFWTRNWRESIINAAKRYDCDVIMLSKSSAENRRGFTDSKWELLRRAQSEVVVVGSDTAGPLRSVLAAVNIQSEDSLNVALNRKILERGKYLADFYDAEYHVANAYKDSEDFPDRSIIQRLVDLPRENIHRDMGKPEDVISAIAQKTGADIVVMGAKGRKGLVGALKGNTSEKVMEKLTVDVLVLNEE